MSRTFFGAYFAATSICYVDFLARSILVVENELMVVLLELVVEKYLLALDYL